MNGEVTVKPVYQENIEPDSGDCFSASLASLLEVELSEIPNFRIVAHMAGKPGNHMMHFARPWLAEQYGLSIVTIQMAKEIETGEDLRLVGAFAGTPCMAGGKSSTFPDTLHCVVGHIDETGMNFVMTHDPNPNGRGLAGPPMHLYFLVPMNYGLIINSRKLAKLLWE